MADRAIRTPRVEQTPLTETACSRREHKTADGRCHAIGHRWLTAYTYACAAALLCDIALASDETITGTSARLRLTPTVRLEIPLTIDGKRTTESIPCQVTQPGWSDESHATAAAQLCAVRLGTNSPDAAACVSQLRAILSKRSRKFYDQIVAKLLGRRRYCSENRVMIVAHPDDEVIFGADALLPSQHLRTQEGLCWTVVCVTHPGKDHARLVDFQNVMDRVNALGLVLPFVDDFLAVPLKEDIALVGAQSTVSAHEWLRLILAGEVGRMMNWTQVVTHGPMGEYGHPQHVAVHDVVRKVMRADKLSRLLWVFQPTRWNHDNNEDEKATLAASSGVNLQVDKEERSSLLQLYTTEATAMSWFGQLQSTIVPLASFDYKAASVGCATEVFEEDDTPGGFGAWTKTFRWFCRSWLK